MYADASVRPTGLGMNIAGWMWGSVGRGGEGEDLTGTGKDEECLSPKLPQNHLNQ